MPLLPFEEWPWCHTERWGPCQNVSCQIYTCPVYETNYALYFISRPYFLYLMFSCSACSQWSGCSCWWLHLKCGSQLHCWSDQGMSSLFFGMNFTCTVALISLFSRAIIFNVIYGLSHHYNSLSYLISPLILTFTLGQPTDWEEGWRY